MLTTFPALTVEEKTSSAEVELERLLQSRTFGKSAALRRLLIYFWENRSEELSEYAIATEALGRRGDFDPRIDSSVRVQTARLRQRLKEYYDGEGAEEVSRILVPPGAYRVQMETVEPAAQPLAHFSGQFPGSVSPLAPGSRQITPASNTPTASAFERPGLVWLLASAVLVILAFVLGSHLGSSGQKSQDQAGRARAIPQFWAQFLRNGRPVHIVVPNPVFFVWRRPGDNSLIVRDPKVNSFEQLSSSAALKDLTTQLGAPSLGEDYTANSDTNASFHLNSFLEHYGAHVTLSSSSNLAPDAADTDNLVLLGTTNTLAPYQSYLDRLDFRFMKNTNDVIDVAPYPGAPAHFTTTIESPSRRISPGVLALIPGKTSETAILIVIGYQSNALIAYLTSSKGLEELEEARKAHGSSIYFQAVIQCETEDWHPLHSKLVAYKPIDSPNAD